MLRRVAATLIKGAGADADTGTKRPRVLLTDAYVDTLPFVGNGTGADAKRRGRDVRLDEREASVWDGVSRDVIESIARAKVLGDSQVRRVLLATGDARLYHLLARVTSGTNLDRLTHLERIRDELRT